MKPDISNKILIVDDEENIRWLFSKALEKTGHTVHTVASAEEALEKVQQNNYLLIFTDIFMEGMSGLDLLQKIRELQPGSYVVVMTAQDTMNNTIEAMRQGAYDYISKPFDLDEIFQLIERVKKSAGATPPVVDTASVAQDFSVGAIIGKSKPMQDVFKTIGKAAMTQLPILITGESGTGKEMVARALHFYSSRVNEPFIFINCAAISRDLLESELFGHEKGAFTGAVATNSGKFELAHRGTLVLDEIGDMELALQAKILRVLQNNEFYRVGGKAPIRVDVRVIAATNQDLPDLMAHNRFREDLYHRLNVIHIHLPPLRERVDDVALLADFFLKNFSGDLSQGPTHLSPEVERILKNYSWPGNIRELENLIKRGLVLAGRGPIFPEHLPPELTQSAEPATGSSWERDLHPLVADFLDQNRESADGNLYDLLMEAVEKNLFEQMLAQVKGNQVATAKALGINRNTLKRKIDAMDIEPKKKKTDSLKPQSGPHPL